VGLLEPPPPPRLPALPQVLPAELPEVALEVEAAEAVEAAEEVVRGHPCRY
jgi:hypothetical protein